jgi:hypothetical protein
MYVQGEEILQPSGALTMSAANVKKVMSMKPDFPSISTRSANRKQIGLEHPKCSIKKLWIHKFIASHCPARAAELLQLPKPKAPLKLLLNQGQGVSNCRSK